jgi:hypothetical protein
MAVSDSTMIPCACGCGAMRRYEFSPKGVLRRFIHGHNSRGILNNSRPGRPDNYRGGPNGKRAHIIVAEAALGHPLPKGAEVHHVDEDKRNNANSNLVICQDKAYHRFLHFRARIVKAGGNPNTERLCCCCKRIFPISGMVRRLTGRKTLSSDCKGCSYQREVNRRAAIRKTKEVPYSLPSM